MNHRITNFVLKGFGGILILASFCLSFLYFQNSNLQKVVDQRKLAFERSDQDREDVKSDKDWFMMQRMYPHNSLPKQVTQKMKRSVDAFVAKSQAHASTMSMSSWKLVGPTNIGGRITAIIIHPTDPNTMYAGAASGGVWKTTDFGGTWSNVFNESFSIGSLAFDPQNPNIIYVGTGEANPSSTDTYPGNGIWRSIDAGATWTNLGLAETGHIGKIVINPQNSNTIFIAALGLYRSKAIDRGVYKSTDRGATWNKVLFVDDTTGCTDLQMDPSDTTRLLAATFTYYRTLPYVYRCGPGSGLYLTTTAGSSWSQVTSGFPYNNPDIGRISIDFAPADPAIVYALVANGGGYNWYGVYKSTDHGSTWLLWFINAGTYSESQVWYNCIIKVDPVSAGHVWAGMTYLYSSVNGANSFGYSPYSGDYHVDFHAMAYAPSDPTKVVIGNDGGVFTSTDGGSNWTKSMNLPITQFYAGNFATSNPNYLMGGSQDNSTMRTYTGVQNSWNIFYGGDGFVCMVDPTDSEDVYAESQNGGLGYSTDGGATFNGGTTGINPSEPVNWMVPIAMDLENPQTLYTGTNYLYQTTNGMQSWTKISPMLTYNQPGFYSTLSTIDVSQTDPGVVYAGTGDGRLWVTTSGGSSWQDITAGLPLRWISRVTVDPHQSNIAYVTLSGFREYDFQGHIYRTSNWGASWTDIGATLPDVPLNDVVVDPVYANVLYIASDLNVMATTDLGAHWSVLGNNLPAITVHDLAYHSQTRTLAAFTHGRSVYTYNLPNWSLAGYTVVSLRGGWNLVSNPVQAPDSSVHTLFPRALTQAFDYSTGVGYTPHDSLRRGEGFWVKFPDTTGLMSVLSNPKITGMSIPVQAGWNLIGSVSDDVPVNTVGASTPGMVTSKFFGYNGGYNTVDTIHPGAGCWVKVNTTGALILNSPGASSAAYKIRIVPTDELPPPPPPSGLGTQTSEIPTAYSLQQNYPNPFNPTTKIEYALPAQSHVSLKIYNMLGQLVQTLVDQDQSTGFKSIAWNAEKFPSGVYFYRLEAVDEMNATHSIHQDKKMVLIK
ncbi:MAG: T9SS type A sorting domain-containing protein [Bacteroidota bacterium]